MPVDGLTGEEDAEGRSGTLLTLAGFGLLVIGVALAGAGAGGAPAGDGPTTSFSLESNETGVWLVADGGESVAADRLELSLDGERLGTWAALADDSDGSVSPGDALRVPGAEPGQELRLAWTDDGASATLFAATVDGER